MSELAPTLERYFTERLIAQKGASAHTISAYADTFRLLLAFAQERTGKAPSGLDFYDIDAPLDRGVLGPPRTRPPQRRAHPQRAACRRALVFPLLSPVAPRARRPYQQGARHPH